MPPEKNKVERRERGHNGEIFHSKQQMTRTVPFWVISHLAKGLCFTN
jgi:hypothetical protein